MDNLAETKTNQTNQTPTEQSVNASNGFTPVRKGKSGKIQRRHLPVEVSFEPEVVVDKLPVSNKSRKNALQKRNFPELFLKDGYLKITKSTSSDDFEVVFEDEEKKESESTPKRVKRVVVDELKQHLLANARVAVKSQKPRHSPGGKPLPAFTVESMLKYWKEHIAPVQPHFKQKCEECGSIRGVDGLGSQHHIHTCSVSSCKTVYCHKHNMKAGEHRQYTWQCPNALQHTTQVRKPAKDFVMRYDPIALEAKREEICKTLNVVAKATIIEDLDFSSIVGDNKDAVITHTLVEEKTTKVEAKKDKVVLPDVELIFVRDDCHKHSYTPTMFSAYPPREKQTKSIGKVFKAKPEPEPKQPTPWKFTHRKWSGKDWASSPITEVGKWFTELIYGKDSEQPVSILKKRSLIPAPRIAETSLESASQMISFNPEIDFYTPPEIEDGEKKVLEMVVLPSVKRKKIKRLKLMVPEPLQQHLIIEECNFKLCPTIIEPPTMPSNIEFTCGDEFDVLGLIKEVPLVTCQGDNELEPSLLVEFKRMRALVVAPPRQYLIIEECDFKLHPIIIEPPSILSNVDFTCEDDFYILGLIKEVPLIVCQGGDEEESSSLNEPQRLLAIDRFKNGCVDMLGAYSLLTNCSIEAYIMRQTLRHVVWMAAHRVGVKLPYQVFGDHSPFDE